jgi:hypothetical protein
MMELNEYLKGSFCTLLLEFKLFITDWCYVYTWHLMGGRFVRDNLSWCLTCNLASHFPTFQKCPPLWVWHSLVYANTLGILLYNFCRERTAKMQNKHKFSNELSSMHGVKVAVFQSCSLSLSKLLPNFDQNRTYVCLCLPRHFVQHHFERVT